MTLLNYYFCNQCIVASNLLNCFRNVSKIKDSTMKNCYKQFARNFIKPCTFNTVTSNLDILCARNLFNVNHMHSLRWTRCSKAGYFFNNSYSKKKNRRTQFAEEMKLKFQSNKLRETKRRFKKKIVEIVCL